MELKSILKNGTSITSSGTTGAAKQIFQSPEKIKYANQAARDVQKITSTSKIYTVCKLDHAGGLLAQTLPAIEIDAEVHIEQFNPFRWVTNIKHFTHSHLTPGMCLAISKTKGWNNLDLEGKIIACGSDRVPAESINRFVAKGATFIANWGMSEVGPMAINKTYTPQDAVAYDLPGYTIMGDTAFCDIQISEWNELMVKGDICVYDDWFATGDIVKFEKGSYWYYGRK
jgi:acyl-CoA synthetase (AMP-forming)/AMP-acid ligase II